MATASRPSSGAYTTLFTHVLEKWWNNEKAEDVVFRNIPLLWILSKTSKKKRKLPKYLTVRILESKSAGGGAWGGYDTVDVTPSKGAQAAQFPVSNYAFPLVMNLEEEWEFTSDEAISDRMEEYVEQVQFTAADRIADDLYGGSVTDSKRVLGLEQALFASTQNDGGGTTLVRLADRWRARQATNQFGGITRTAYTGHEVGGTGWENIAIDMADTGGAIRFGFTSGAPNAALQALFQLYTFATWGASSPDLIISSLAPFEDYHFAAMEKQVLEKTNIPAFGDAELAFRNIKFQGSTWILDEFATTRNSTYGTANANSHNIYLLNTRFLDLAVDSRADFDLGMPKEPVDQFAAVRQMVWRGQLVFRNPRYFARGFNYAETSA